LRELYVYGNEIGDMEKEVLGKEMKEHRGVRVIGI